MNRKKWDAAQAALLELTESTISILERRLPYGLSEKQRSEVLDHNHQIVMDAFGLRNVFSDSAETNECEIEHLLWPVRDELADRRNQTNHRATI